MPKPVLRFTSQVELQLEHSVKGRIKGIEVNGKPDHLLDTSVNSTHPKADKSPSKDKSPG